jgi:hypothetical protein
MDNSLNKYQDIEPEFSSNLLKFLKYFNLLERNLGLSISFLVNDKDPHVAYPFLEKLNTQGKLDILKELIFYKNSETNEEIINDFNRWFKEALETKAIRNRYIHGYWHIRDDRTENPIIFSPTTWTSGVGKVATETDSDQYMSLSEFKDVVQKMEALFESFSALRGKYGI